MLKAGTHHSPKLQAAWDKYGENAFTFTVLSECPKELCGFIEQTMIDKFEAAIEGYNIQPRVFITPDDISKAQAASNKPRPRKPCSEETKEKISQANKGNQAWLGKHHTEETKAKIGAINKEKQLGRHHTEETKAKMAKARREFWSDPDKVEQQELMKATLKVQHLKNKPGPRKPHSEETKIKLRLAQLAYQAKKRS